MFHINERWKKYKHFYDDLFNINKCLTVNQMCAVLIGLKYVVMNGMCAVPEWTRIHDGLI